MKKIGFVLHKKNKAIMLKTCHDVWTLQDSKTVAQEIKEVIKRNKEAEFYIHSLKDLEMQLIQYYPLFLILKEQNKLLYILEKEELTNYSDESLFNILYQLAELENHIISERTIRGIEKARLDGVVPGRPKLEEKKIKEIKKHYNSRNKTLKEIALLCDVSIGTVYKYTKA